MLSFNSKKDAVDRICFLAVWAVLMAVSVYFCTQKTGFHEDEYYTYYSTARTNGFYVSDGQWMDREVYGKEFVVLPDQRFQYGFVKLVQSWDVHPPMYYWIFHTVASLVPNVFSKWIGLSVNLFFHGINIVLLWYLAYLAGGRDRRLALLVTLFAGLGPAVVSGVVFIRMYEMLTTLVLLCAVLHVRAAAEGGMSRRSRILRAVAMMAVTYVGFLTHYYYFIFLFYMGAAFVVWQLWRDRHIRNCVWYALIQGTALALAVLTYPSCLGQMFRGQRGAQATENFFDISNTIERIRFFWDLLDRYVFGQLFWGVLAVILLLAAAGLVTKKQDIIRLDIKEQAGYFILLFAGTGYFLTVSKTALLLGETSNRYQLPVYGIAVLLVFGAVRALWRRALQAHKVAGRAAVLAVLLFLAAGLSRAWREGVLFLYPEDRGQTAYARECAADDTPVIYFYRTGEEWCVWAVANELLAYPQFYVAAVDGEGMIDEERIRNADSLVVYIASGADEEKNLQRVSDSAPALSDSQWERVYEQQYCTVYHLGR
ncbi:MAG: glycosyltransferase family 39 protein [Lachnospiraceae bacterium]|jgi:hypothetical protein|nr:glycosyltransferase family 39 protein [Lachnospiraceae bacterium]